MVTHLSQTCKKRRKKTEVSPKPKGLVNDFFASVDLTTTSKSYAVLPYIKGLTETRVLRKHSIKVFSKPVKTLQQKLPSRKHRFVAVMLSRVRSVQN